VSLHEHVIALAVAWSPADQRTTRREQWAADVRDAHELGLRPGQVARGALLTTVVRRTARRPGDGPVAPVLVVAAAVVSVLVAVAFEMRVGGHSGTGQWGWYGFMTVDALLGSVLPALAVAAVLVVRGTRRTAVTTPATAALVLVAVVVGTAPVWLGPTLVPGDWVLPSVGLAAFLLCTRGPGARWAALALPALLSVATHQSAGSIPATWLPLVDHLPALLALVVGTLLVLSSPRQEASVA
jgi:hypothetical protein